MSERKNNLEQLKKDLEEKKQQGHSDEINQLLKEVELQQQNPAQCNPIIYDCCTVTLAPESIVEFPYGLVNIGADFFFLKCCSNETTIDAYTPCGTILNACKVKEVKAIGHINFVTSFTIPTYYNNGQNDCSKRVDQTFSCTGTTCVNNTLCYTALYDENACPDFCNGNTKAYAFIKDIDYCSDSKAIVTIGIIFKLPECNNASEPEPVSK